MGGADLAAAAVVAEGSNWPHYDCGAARRGASLAFEGMRAAQLPVKSESSATGLDGMGVYNWEQLSGAGPAQRMLPARQLFRSDGLAFVAPHRRADHEWNWPIVHDPESKQKASNISMQKSMIRSEEEEESAKDSGRRFAQAQPIMADDHKEKVDADILRQVELARAVRGQRNCDLRGASHDSALPPCPRPPHSPEQPHHGVDK